jgi:hypothetical protein
MDLLVQIIQKQKEFEVDAVKRENGNKAAGARARKVSLELTKLYKQFRKESV